MDARQQLLQSLMRDLESFQLPERYTAAQKAQIERGRKGQKDIDAGRATIAENERLFQEAIANRKTLQDRIGTLQGEIDTVGTKAKQDDPWNQAAQYGKSIGVPLAGYGAGHYIGHKFGKGFDEASVERRASVRALADRLRSTDGTAPGSRGAAAGAVDTYDKEGLGKRSGRSSAQFLGPAALGALSFGTKMGADYAEDPYLKEGLNLASTAERAGAGGMLLQQVIDTLRPSKKPSVDDVAEIETARGLLGTDRSNPQGALKPAPPPPPPPPPDGPTLRTPSDRLTSAARAAGATGKLTKKTAVDYLAANVTDANRAAVATELGVGPGQRIAGAVKKLSTSRKPSVIVAPMIAAGLGYDAASSEAEAAGATPAEAQTRGAVAGTGAAAVTGGAGYGLSKLANFAPVKSLLSAAGRMSGPLMLNDMAVQAHRGIYGSGPQYLEVPEKSPFRSQLSNYAAEANGPLSSASALQIPENIPPNAARDAEAAAMASEGPSPARAAYGDQKFDDALSGFLAMIEEYNSSVSQGAQQ